MPVRRSAFLALVGALLIGGLVPTSPALAVTPGGTTTPAELLTELTTSVPVVTGYDRDLFPHWIDADSDGCTTRQEVLIAESATPAVVASDCTVESGQWESWYDGSTWTAPSDVDIDHVVALSEAWKSGAHAWSADQRQSFANDLDFDLSLEAVTDSVNASKSDRDPAQWLPPLTETHCRYATTWVLVKWRWNLSVDTAERAAISSIFEGGCGDSVVTAPAKAGPVSSTEQVIRLSGADRYEMAVNVSRRFDAGVPVVYIAKGTDYPDALSAAPAAAAEGGPVLLTFPTSLPQVVADELERLQPQKIVVVGGRASVTDSVFAQLQPFAPEVIRLDGADRYAASRAVVEYAFGETGASRVYLTTGAKFPDALSASPAASVRDGAVLLVYGAGSNLDAPTVATLQKLNPTDVVIAGGPASVSVGIENSLAALGTPSPSYRLTGADRYEAALAINQDTFSDAEIVFLATGLNFPDALAGAALAGKSGSPLFIVPGTCVPQSILAEISAMNPSQLVLLGGPNSLAPAVESLTPCEIAPSVSIGFSCDGGVSVSVTNPNTYGIPIDVLVNSSPRTSATVPAQSSTTIAAGSLTEDATSSVWVALRGSVIKTAVFSVNCEAPQAPLPPDKPADLDCGDFSTWAAANAFYQYYYPYYGDFANLDGTDNDGIVCESLPGAP